MGELISAAGLSSAACLTGFQRVIGAVTSSPSAPPARGQIYLEFSFFKVGFDPPPVIASVPCLCPCLGQGQAGFELLGGGAGTTEGPPGVNPPKDRIVVRADLGSYRIRPQGSVNMFAPVGIWEVALWHSFDPCDDDETLWWSQLLPPGPFIPPPYYHLLRVLSGTVTYLGNVLVNGFEMSLPASGADLAVVGGAVVQLGFRI